MSIRLPTGLAVLAVTVSLGAAPAFAVPITFDEGTLDATTQTYTEDGFVFVPASLNNSANCPAAGPCLLANNGAFSTISMKTESGVAFDVDSFAAEFAGNGGILKVTGLDTVTQEETFLESTFGNDPFLAVLNFTNITELVFEFSGGGTARIDNISATPIPIPASLSLLVGALGGLLYIGRRRRTG